ncbi:Hcp family type VI secretion system effector [Cohnella suwonensis]|uniref:Hcp family type VI secretion system effector n=1 Tax=Cohnella suwonensis TaxID=696072 RepID=A0ABW0LVF0_9BACL
MRKKLAIALVLLLLLTGAASAAADTAAAPGSHPALAYKAYLKLDGITGESNASGYENWIVLTGLQFDIANSLASSQGGGSGGGKSTLSQFAVTKKTDAASVPIVLASLSGTSVKTGRIVLVPQGEGALPHLTIDLGSVQIAGYSFDNAVETIMLKFDTIKLSYFPTNPNGSKETPVTGGWSVSQNRKL